MCTRTLFKGLSADGGWGCSFRNSNSLWSESFARLKIGSEIEGGVDSFGVDSRCPGARIGPEKKQNKRNYGVSAFVQSTDCTLHKHHLHRDKVHWTMCDVERDQFEIQLGVFVNHMKQLLCDKLCL